MADVTISSLPLGTPSGNLVLPISNGINTYSAPLSDIQVNYSKIINTPRIAYAVLSQIGTAPYTVATLASSNVQSITVNSATADITINWTTNYFKDENYCISFGVQAGYTGNRSSGINIQTGSSSKTRNNITIMAGSVSDGRFYPVPNINILAIQ